MLYTEIDSLIVGATKSGNEFEKKVYRDVKTQLVNAIHSGIKMNEDEEVKILKRMIKQCNAAAEEFSKATGELAKKNMEENLAEAKFLEQFVPSTPDPAKVKEEAMCTIKTFVELKTMEDPNFNPKTLQRYTKDIIAKVKEKYPGAEPGVIAGTIKEYLAQ